jgi:hypothetical protein
MLSAPETPSPHLLTDRQKEALSLLGVTIILTLIGALIGGIFYVPVQNLPLLLSTLAGAQAALFGVAFAITILSIQLTTNRYSPRTVFLFIDGWPFKTVFAVFVTSTGYNVLLLSQVGSPPSRYLTAGVTAAYGLALGAVIILYWFVRTTLAQSTPEGLIDAIADELPPSKYIVKSHEKVSADELHPLHRLYSIIMAALSRGESETAYRGLRTLDEITDGGLENAQSNQDELTEEEIEAGFETVQEEYLPEIALHAYENDEQRTATEAIDILEQLGQDGLDNEIEAVTRYSAEGLSEIIDQPPLVIDASVVRNAAIDSLSNLLEASVCSAEFRTYRRVSTKLNGRIVVLLRRNADNWVYHDFILDYVDRTLPNLIEALIDHHEYEIEDKKIDWPESTHQEEAPMPDAAERLLEYHRQLGRVTESILRYTSRNDEYPLPSGNFKGAWTHIATEAAQSPLKSYAVLVSQTHITTAYYIDQIENEIVGSWARGVASVMSNGDKSVVQQAFDQLEQGEYPEHKLVSVYLSSDTDRDKVNGLLGRLLATSTADELSFEEWLTQFREEVENRYTRLEGR